MNEYIGYSNELFDYKKLDEFYKTLEITPNDYMRAALNALRFTFEYNINLLRKPLNYTAWLNHGVSTLVNTIYTPQDNSIEVPAAELQDIFFNKGRLKCMNFAAIGWLIAREITHSFDEDGSQYDKYGIFAEWWQPETKKKYAQKTDCIVQQYEKYTVKELGLKLNGKSTKQENIADNEGLKATYQAYQNWVKQYGLESKLPGLKYSPWQIFWITAAQTLCTKYTKKGLQETSMQSPAEFRIRGAFSNRPEFAKDFNCPVGSNMNPVKKSQDIFLFAKLFKVFTNNFSSFC